MIMIYSVNIMFDFESNFIYLWLIYCGKLTDFLPIFAKLLGMKSI